MKEFNLKRALAGDSVVTRNGEIVTQVKHFINIQDTQTVRFVVNKTIKSVIDNGKRWDNTESELDLFMAPIKKKGWINMYEDTAMIVYDTKEEAIAANLGYPDVKTAIVEWEE